jgi:hypothetical protein
VKDGQLLSSAQRASPAGTSIAVALLAGFVASVAMVMAFAVAFVAALVLSRLPVPILADWFRGLTSNRLIDAAGPNLYAATAVFFIGGLIWALLFAIVLEPRLRGAAWERGVQFALVPWLFSLVVFMPLVGGGPLGLGLGAGPLPILGNLILHLVYGAALGTVWGSAESVIDRPLRAAYTEDLQVGRLSEIGAARGLGVGLAIGLIVGVLANALVPQATGMNPLAIILAIGLSCAAFGGFVGSLSLSS